MTGPDPGLILCQETITLMATTLRSLRGLLVMKRYVELPPRKTSD